MKKRKKKEFVKFKFVLPLKACGQTHSAPRVNLKALSISIALSETNSMRTQYPLKTEDWRLKGCWGDGGPRGGPCLVWLFVMGSVCALKCCDCQGNSSKLCFLFRGSFLQSRLPAVLMIQVTNNLNKHLRFWESYKSPSWAGLLSCSGVKWLIPGTHVCP